MMCPSKGLGRDGVHGTSVEKGQPQIIRKCFIVNIGANKLNLCIFKECQIEECDNILKNIQTNKQNEPTLFFSTELKTYF